METRNTSPLRIGGLDPQELAEEFGTPLFVYDAGIMEDRYKRLKSAFKDLDLHIHFACKALNNINVLRFFHKLGSGLDTVSIDEVKLGLKAGFEPQQIMYTPNGVSIDEVCEAVELGVKVNIDNLSILEQFGSRYGSSYPVCVRLNPHIMAGGHLKISTGHIDSKFGISVYQSRLLHRIVETYKIKVEGLHMHTGSDILDVDVFLKGADILLDAALEFKELNYIDFGSGFKVPYKPNDYATDLEELGEKMTSRFQAFCRMYGRDLALAFEPGKYLVSESGYFLCKVNVVKQTTSTVFAGVNSGFNHFIRPMLYEAYHHIVNVTNPEGKERIYSVVGYICETDTLAADRKISEIREDDILCFFNAGAYLITMSSNYNSRPKPAEVLVYNGKAHQITKRQTFDDILRDMIEVEL